MWRWWWPWEDEVAEGEPRRRRMTGGGQRGHGFWDGPVDADALLWFPGREVREESARGGRPAGTVSPDVPYAVADGVPLEAYRAALEASTGQCGACWGTGAAEDQLGVGDRGVIPCERCDGTGLWQGGLPDPGLVSDAEVAALVEQTLAEEGPAEDEDDDEAHGDEEGEADVEPGAGEAETGDEVAGDASESDEGNDADEAGGSAGSGDEGDTVGDGSWDDGGWGDDAADDGEAGDDGGPDGGGGSDGSDASGGGGTGQ